MVRMPFFVRPVENILDVLNYVPIPTLVLPQGLLHLFPLGNVLDGAANPGNTSPLILDKPILDENWKSGAVFSPIRPLKRASRKPKPGQFFQDLLPGQIFFDVKFPHVLPDHFSPAVA